MEREHTPKEIEDIKIWNFTQTDPIWDILRSIILDKINNAKDNCFNAEGQVADFDRGIGTGLQELIVAIEAMANNGQELLNEPD